jgi:hypothetical protein
MRPVWLCLAIAGAATAQQPQRFDCAADGSVTNSLTGEPVVRARVNLNIAGTPYTATTDESGKWKMFGLGCGSSFVNVSRVGFLQILKGPPIRAVLTPGSPVHDLKSELTPQSAIFGKVLDNTGDPVMNAEVTVFQARVVEGRFSLQSLNSYPTNDLGEFRVPALRAGNYTVCTRAPQISLLAGFRCYPGPPADGRASAMELPAGREMRVDLTLTETPEFHIRGTVSGIPPGRDFEPNLILVSDPGSARRNQVQPDGRFDIARVPPGSYILIAEYLEPIRPLIARVPIEVGSSDIDAVSVTLEPLITLNGTVRIESQSGEKAPAPQFEILMRPTQPQAGTGQVRWSADSNSFTISHLPPAGFTLEASPPLPFYIKSATLGGQDVLHGGFSVAKGVGPLEIVLRDDAGSVEGETVDGDGLPVPSGVVLVPSRGGRPVNTQTGLNGHFNMANIPPGEYMIYAWDNLQDAEYADDYWLRKYGGNGVAVTVETGQKVPVKLTRQATPPL